MRFITFLSVIFFCGAIHAENFYIESFTISAGEEKDISLCFTNEQTWAGFQINIFLPEGVSIVEDEDGLYYEVTERLQYKSGRKTVDMDVNAKQVSDGSYRFIISNMGNANISGNDGAVLTLKIVASDMVSTGSFTPVLKDQKLSNVDGSVSMTLDNATYSCTVGIKTTVTTLGYASFSWPKALDFSNSGLTAFIATSCDGSTIQLESVTKVPANTGLILKGTAGSENTYDLKTTEEETDDVTGNKLSANTTDVYTVASDDIYVLSNLDDGKAGFYLAEQGVHVGKYKSYLQYAGTGVRKNLSFHEEQPTGIHNMDGRTADRLYFNLQGQRVNNPAKGLYISAGKKIIIK